MSRIPAKPSSELPSEQRDVHDAFQGAMRRLFGDSGDKFVFEASNGGLIGPFPFFIANPKIGKAIFDLMFRLAQLPLPADARETAIMTVGGHFGACYQTYSHFHQAIEAGLSHEQAEILQQGERKPDGLNEKCGVAYDVTKHLVSVKGPLPLQL